MPDREKVIKKAERIMCSTVDRDMIDSFCEDVIALLKEQEAVKPVTESSVYDPDTWFFVCGSCKKGVIDRGDKFCRWCGKAVKWK